VDGMVDVSGNAGLPIDRGDVINDVDAGRCRLDRLRIANITADEDSAGARQVGGLRGIDVADERTDLVAAREQAAHEVAAREAGRAGYKDAHRSATIDTGEPKTFNSPT